MNNQKIIKFSVLEKEQEKLLKIPSFVDRYEKKEKIFSEQDCLENPDIKTEGKLKLRLPDEHGHYDAENAKLIFEYYKHLTPVQASDARLWTYLAHFDFYEYVHLRFPIEEKKGKGNFIMEHWYLNGISPFTLMRHGIARLWWGAYSTYDEKRSNHYELTNELFSMLDYTRTITTGTQGRNKDFAHAVLEFVIENPELFKSQKQDKVRFIMRKMNYAGGYKILPSLSKKDIKNLLEQYRLAIQLITKK